MTKWSVWKEEREYRKLFLAGVVNGVGNRFTQVAALTLLYQVTGSGAAIGLLFLIRMIPFLLIAPLGGILADKFQKKALLVGIDLCRIPFALTPLLVNEPGELWIVYVSAFLLASGEALYAPTRMSSIPILVQQEKLLYVNAIEQIMVGIVLIVGSTAGGMVAYLFGLEIAFSLNALSFLLSAYFLRTITFTKDSYSSIQSNPPTTKRPSIHWIVSSFAVMTFLLIECTMPLANGIDNVLLSVYALDVFDKGELGVGLIYGFLGLGFVFSSLLSPFLNKNLLAFIVSFIALEGVGHLFLSVAPTFALALLSVLFITFVGGISNICLSTIMMKVIPKPRQGMFFGLTTMISNTTLGVTMGIGGLLVEAFEPRMLSLAVGIGYLFLTFIYALAFFKLNLKREKRTLAKSVR
ncbi:MFS transporter [Alkalihalophilus sp. As8PL]|uniref:MFS transporter n=1 Tax=Alkalihalophilus sp. As8PL TaxID=3237103 RepID=A0AB39BXD3_9BACI